MEKLQAVRNLRSWEKALWDYLPDIFTSFKAYF